MNGISGSGSNSMLHCHVLLFRIIASYSQSVNLLPRSAYIRGLLSATEASFLPTNKQGIDQQNNSGRQIQPVP